MPCTQAKTRFPRCKASSSNANFRSCAHVCPFLSPLPSPLGVHFCHGVAAWQSQLCWFSSLWVHVMNQIKQLIRDKKKEKETRRGWERRAILHWINSISRCWLEKRSAHENQRAAGRSTGAGVSISGCGSPCCWCWRFRTTAPSPNHSEIIPFSCFNFYSFPFSYLPLPALFPVKA